ncbi:MAG: APC family permease [Gammaproteobacteria bacterium]|nr:APC family permease [Gammaproteobacteria bacterium]
MTADPGNAAVDPQLRRNALGLPELVFQGVTHIAPAANMMFAFPIVALQAGPDMPLSFLLAMVACLFIGNTVAEFSRYMPSSGGYYSFTTRGLGTRWGFITTWSYLIYDFLGPAGTLGFFGYLISDMLRAQFGVDIAWWLFALADFAIVWILTRHGIRLSMQTTAILGGLELLIMLALAVGFLIHPGPGSSYLAPLQPSLSPNHFQGIVAGMVLAILSLSGFESPAPLAQESRRAGTLVGQAVTLSLLAIGVFYIFTSYASAIGWGTGNMAAFAHSPNPYYDLGHALWGAGWWFVVLALFNSSIAVGLACTNSCSRVMYTMGRAGTLPARFGKIHPAHRTPAFAIAFQQMSGITAVLLVGLLLRPEDVFGFLETISALAAIVLYSMANLALTAYMRDAHPESFSTWRHVVFPWAGTLMLVPVLFVTVYPVPAWPYNLVPYLFLAAMIVGYGYMRWLESSNPAALQRGATMLVGARTSGGEVDWDTTARRIGEPT